MSTLRSGSDVYTPRRQYENKFSAREASGAAYMPSVRKNPGHRSVLRHQGLSASDADLLFNVGFIKVTQAIANLLTGLVASFDLSIGERPHTCPPAVPERAGTEAKAPIGQVPQAACDRPLRAQSRHSRRTRTRR
jgi:hypothetical protein